MSKKIVITGGLGYIGTELCKLYSGVSWNNTIIVIDNRFISERVNQLIYSFRYESVVYNNYCIIPTDT